MRLTTFSDYALRLLMYAAAHSDRLITIDEACRSYRISRGHLMKVANLLTREGFLTAVRGRSGGLKLGMQPKDIRIGAIVRATEPDFAMVECFATGNQCIVTQACRLPHMLNEALNSFIRTLDRYTLEDLMLSPGDFVSPPRRRTAVRGPVFEPTRAR